MYIATLKIYKEDTLDLVIEYILGTFNRPSTAERLRREMQKHNPYLLFTLVYEQTENYPVSVD